jgi:hypothetical protein
MTEFHKPHIWFALDEHGEPHENNPDDGYGGHLIKSIEHVREFDKNEPITTPEQSSNDENTAFAQPLWVLRASVQRQRYGFWDVA